MLVYGYFLLSIYTGNHLSICIFVHFRWGFVTHGCIDGASRLITYLSCGTNNRSSTVLSLFVQACVKYGLPTRARCDHGGENVKVGLFMNLLRAPDSTNGIITGVSVHNQRIERLWRDVFLQIISVFYGIFYKLEDEGKLDSENSTHLYALQRVFLPRIQHHLRRFQIAWNNHGIRTEHQKTPEQLWLAGMLQNINSGHTAVNYVFSQDVPCVSKNLSNSLEHFGLNLEQFNNMEDTNGNMELPRNTIDLPVGEVDDIFNEILLESGDLEPKCLYSIFVDKLEEAISEIAIE